VSANPRDVLAALRDDPKAKTFAGRVRIARTLLGKPLGAGSGRVVFDLGDGTVLKIAKNPKGVSQNGMETDGFIQQEYDDVIATVVDSDPDDLWLVMVKAKKVGTRRFEQLTGIASRRTSYGGRLTAHYLLLSALQKLWMREHGPGFSVPSSSLTDEDAEKILSLPFAERIVSLMRDMDMPPGDFGRLSTYGELNGRLVLVDYGLSSGVWAEHYSRNRSRYWGVASDGEHQTRGR
jgi:hypothetical protein